MNEKRVMAEASLKAIQFTKDLHYNSSLNTQ